MTREPLIDEATAWLAFSLGMLIGFITIAAQVAP